jgi:hypothetical protein
MDVLIFGILALLTLVCLAVNVSSKSRTWGLFAGVIMMITAFVLFASGIDIATGTTTVSTVVSEAAGQSLCCSYSSTVNATTVYTPIRTMLPSFNLGPVSTNLIDIIALILVLLAIYVITYNMEMIGKS